MVKRINESKSLIKHISFNSEKYGIIIRAAVNVKKPLD